MDEYHIKIWETVSLGCEILAFPFVTLDLFGKTRLEGVDEKLKMFLSRTSVKTHSYGSAAMYDLFKKHRDQAKIAGFYVLPALLSIVVDSPVIATVATVSLMLYVAFYLRKFFLLICRQTYSIAKIALCYPLHFLASKALTLFAYEKTEGVMVVIGAVLFAVSKSIAVYLCWCPKELLH